MQQDENQLLYMYYLMEGLVYREGGLEQITTYLNPWRMVTGVLEEHMHSFWIVGKNVQTQHNQRLYSSISKKAYIYLGRFLHF